MRHGFLLASALLLALSGCAFTNDFDRFRRPRDGSADGMDGGGPAGDGGADSDGGEGRACAGDGDCDDGVSCTTDTCEDGTCRHAPDDARCTAGGGGVCDAVQGCQYDRCNEATCLPGPCQTARCEGDVCVRENTCASDQICCGDACVPEGCDDGVACTTDSCGADGCVHAPDDAQCEDDDPCTVGVCTASGCMQMPAADGTSCDDGIYCNGADTCASGACTQHAGDPCPGASRCEESAGACVGCASASDCPDPVLGTWSDCEGAVCSESGTQTRSVTTFECVAGTCESSTSTETQSCSRTPETTCGATACSGWSGCDWASSCATTATQSRTCTTPTCQDGSCVEVTTTETRACNRATEGVSCGSTSCTDWVCGGFDDVCDEGGTETRTCTDRVCRSESCVSEDRDESRSCSRDTDGDSCGADSCTDGPCVDNGRCGGERTVTCTPRVCSGGSCGDGSSYTSTEGCPLIAPNGTPCEVGGETGICCGGLCDTDTMMILCEEPV